MKNLKHARGTMMIEVMVTGVLVATATLGAAGALISGLTLEANSDRTMSEVATAENLLARIRGASEDDFAGMHTSYNSTTHAARESTGSLIQTKRQLRVELPLAEAALPSLLDLDGDGLYDGTVTPDAARMLVVDVAGSDKLRLRTAVLNFGQMRGIAMGRSSASGSKPVGFGETRPPAPPPTGGGGSTPPPTGGGGDPTPPPAQTDSQVTPLSGSMQGKTAVIVLRNSSGGDLTPVSITIAPNDKNLYFESIDLAGSTLFVPSSGIDSGTVTIPLANASALPAGESSLEVGDFFKIDKKKGKKLKSPKDVVVTIQFNDGSVATITVKK